MVRERVLLEKDEKETHTHWERDTVESFVVPSTSSTLAWYGFGFLGLGVLGLLVDCMVWLAAAWLVIRKSREQIVYYYYGYTGIRRVHEYRVPYMAIDRPSGIDCLWKELIGSRWSYPGSVRSKIPGLGTGRYLTSLPTYFSVVVYVGLSSLGMEWWSISPGKEMKREQAGKKMKQT